MNKSIIRYLAVGWIGATAVVNGSQAVWASGPEAAPQITVYVYNWADVEPNTLREAKAVVGRIFRRAGVEATVLDHPLPSAEEQGKVLQRVGPSDFFVHILSLPMAERFGFPTQVLGIAPGTTQELDRNKVYISDHVAERTAQAQSMARAKGIVSHNANKGQLLGHGMAHEIGHVLLQQAAHSPVGLMRANWDRDDMRKMVAGYLLLTPKEAERVRAEITRRNAVLPALEIGR